MPRVDTYLELFIYTAWARDKVLASASPLRDAQLDRPFEMGEGSLRATLRHLYGSERTWYERWRQQGGRQIDFPHAHELNAIAEIAAAHRALAAARDAEVARLADADFDTLIHYVAPQDGQPRAYPLGGILLQAANHGVHHRAQALYMLRQVGAALPAPGLDYIFMKREQGAGSAEALDPQTGDPALRPRLDLDTLRRYYAYSDWAWRNAYAAAAGLSDAQLDRPFDLGCRTLRATLAHLRFAEQWWLENWTLGAGRPFPETDERISVAELTRLFDETVAARERFLAGLTDADLQRSIEAEPRPGLRLTFTLGVSMLQLCTHGTHHRAQALNMLRHVGGRPPALDYVAMLREQALAGR